MAGHFTRPGIDFRETLNEMLSCPHDPQFNRGWRTSSGLKTATHPVVSEKAQEMLDKESKELSGVLSTAKTALALYSDPLVATPDEVMRLRPPQKSGNGSSEKIVVPGDMLIFVSGHFPILGMQMLYFFDPELQRRAEIPPPNGLKALRGKPWSIRSRLIERATSLAAPKQQLMRRRPAIWKKAS